MIELTDQQHHDLSTQPLPVRVIDPATREEFVLLPLEAFARLQASLSDIDPRETYTAVDQAFAPGWNDPKMADYDNYEQHKK